MLMQKEVEQRVGRRVEVMRQTDLANECTGGKELWRELAFWFMQDKADFNILEEAGDKRTQILPSIETSGRASRSLSLFPKESEEKGEI